MYAKQDIVLGAIEPGKYFAKEVSHTVQKFYGIGSYGRWFDVDEPSPYRIPEGSFGKLLFG